MTSFREIERRSADLVCPQCGTCSIRVFLRCDTGDRQCLTVGSCRRCGRHYDAEVLPTYLEQYQAMVQIAEKSPCPVCAGRQRVVRSLCDRRAQECFFLFACCTCGDVRLA